MVLHCADYMVEILDREINKNHEPDEHILSKVILSIAEIRSFRQDHIKAIENCIEDCYDMGIPQVILELFAIEEPAAT